MEKKIFFESFPSMKGKFYFYAEHNTMRSPMLEYHKIINNELIKAKKTDKNSNSLYGFHSATSRQMLEEIQKYEVFQGYDGEEEELFFHYHIFAELSIILSGEGYYFVDGKAIKVQKGSIIFFNKLVPHAWCASEGNPPKQITFSFYSDLLFSEELEKEENKYMRDFFNELKYWTKDGEEAKKNFKLWESIYEEYERQENGYKAMIKYFIIIFFTYELRKLGISEYQKPKKNSHEELDQAINYMKTNFHNNITLEEVAQAVYMHPNYFSTLFKKKYGVSFITYMNGLKADMATELMQSTELGLEEVALRCGFSSVSNFYRVFKQIYKVSPGKYSEKQMITY